MNFCLVEGAPGENADCEVGKGMTSEFRNAGARNVTAVGLVWCPSDGHSLSIAFESFENRQISTGSTAQAINSAVQYDVRRGKETVCLISARGSAEHVSKR